MLGMAPKIVEQIDISATPWPPAGLSRQPRARPRGSRNRPRRGGAFF